MDPIWQVLFYALLAAVPGYAWFKVARAEKDADVIDALRTAALITVLTIGVIFAAATFDALGVGAADPDTPVGLF